MYSLECSLADVTKARELEAVFDDFARLPHGNCLRAPWEAASVTAAETRARRTVASLSRERSRVLQAEYAKLDRGQRDTGSPDQVWATHETRILEAQDASKQAYQDLIDAHRSDDAFDGEAAALYLQEAAVHEAEEDDEYDESAAPEEVAAGLAAPCSSLIAKLGAGGGRCLSNRVHNMSHARMEGDALVVTGFDDQLEVTLPLVSRYMCAAGCDLRYSAHTLSPR
jgi:hypothetical protein